MKLHSVSDQGKGSRQLCSQNFHRSSESSLTFEERRDDHDNTRNNGQAKHEYWSRGVSVDERWWPKGSKGGNEVQHPNDEANNPNNDKHNPMV